MYLRTAIQTIPEASILSCPGRQSGDDEEDAQDEAREAFGQGCVYNMYMYSLFNLKLLGCRTKGIGLLNVLVSHCVKSSWQDEAQDEECLEEEVLTDDDVLEEADSRNAASSSDARPSEALMVEGGGDQSQGCEKKQEQAKPCKFEPSPSMTATSRCNSHA